MDDTDFYYEHHLDYVVPNLQQLFFLLLHILMLILITTTVRPYKVMYRLIFHHDKRLMVLLAVIMLLFAGLLEAPYIVLSHHSSVYESSALFNNHVWCRFGECSFWTLSHIIDSMCAARCCRS